MPTSTLIAIAGNNLKPLLRQDSFVGSAQPTFLLDYQVVCLTTNVLTAPYPTDKTTQRLGLQRWQGSSSRS